MLRPLNTSVSGLSVWSLRLAFLALLVAAFGIYVGRTAAVPLQAAFAVIGSALCLASLAAVLAVAAFVVIWRDGARGLGSAYAGLSLALLVLAWPGYLAGLSLALPVINDLTTDLASPPVFSPTRQAILKRGSEAPSAYDQGFSARQRASYPDIQPITLDLGVDETYRLVLEALQPRRLTLVEAVGPQRARDEAYIEAVDRSPLLRLPDDIVIRIRPSGQETRIDIRSKSRIGRHDFGSNAARIRSLSQDIAALAKDR